ncbi:MAG: phosphotransferase family protein, partial [Aestuariivirga sp.]|nr:phosphotransferase family protein [Aestuariivirga sp.]
TAAEKSLEAAVARMPAFAGRTASYVPLVGGLMNGNFRVSLAGEERRYFVKVPGVGSEKFIDRKAAHAAATNAFRMGIGPEVIHFDPETGIEAFEFLEGYRACTNADFRNEAIQSEVIDLYKAFNSGSLLPLTKTIFDMIDEHFAQARELGSHLPSDFPWLERRYEEAKAAMLASGLDLVPCFNDPMPGNFLQKPGAPMKLVDCEFTSNNERAYELGVFIGEMFYPEERSLELIERYYGDARPSTVARVNVARMLADIKWASWAIVNRKLSSWDFDYQKYGAWKYMRARSLLFDPRWEAWLRKL